MSFLVDVVNFNSDASCLDSRHWLAILQGGEQSQLFRWLRLYIDYGKPISLGFTGASLADIDALNPESIKLVRDHSDVFQILLRPFAHDLPFFRTDEGFRLNLSLGRRSAEYLIGRVSSFYLPPEFMQTNRQSALLAKSGVAATFIMASRFRERFRRQITPTPFLLDGIPNGELICLPTSDGLTDAYLSTIQLLDPSIWSKAVSIYESAILWRDGESAFLLPDGVERERLWITNCQCVRQHLSQPDRSDLVKQIAGYPIHPFTAWLNEMSMLWFIQRVRELEFRMLESMTPSAIASWLHCINSDILSAVEKDSPVVQLRPIDSGPVMDYAILRSDRAFEGESLLEIAEKGVKISGDQAWLLRAFIRERHVHDLL